jgi:hypothetical protein
MKNSRPLLLLCIVLALAAPAAQARPELCEDAARRVALETGVPHDVLHAISLTETGRAHQGRMRPWPWAANIDGQGYWFDGPDAALAFARENLARGRRSFDLGCFQINWRWHGEHFASPQMLLDPLTSARYAARFLTRLFDELGSWEAAAGAYHSRTPHLAERYRARFARFRQGLGQGLAGQFAVAEPPAATSTSRAEAEPRINTFPFLQLAAEPGGGPALASLVPATTGARPFLALDGMH